MQEQASPITEDVVKNVCTFVTLNLSAERVAELTPQLQNFFALFSMLDALELDDVEPVTVFNAEWR
jgi:Asp-tRNA(Asn)/Glu-tRNA(Gln) amidotransferase C subunit